CTSGPVRLSSCLAVPRRGVCGPSVGRSAVVDWEKGADARLRRVVGTTERRRPGVTQAPAGGIPMAGYMLVAHQTALSDQLLREAGGAYAGIVLSTLPPGSSGWLKLDVISRAQRQYPDMRVTHVFGTAATDLPAAA